jgi:hypothetical protein
LLFCFEREAEGSGEERGKAGGGGVEARSGDATRGSERADGGRGGVRAGRLSFM